MKFSSGSGVITCSILLSLLLIGCGGGGSGSEDPPLNDSGEPTYTAGVYENANLYANRCETPRTGTDIRGDAWPDRPGSVLFENHWLRSWSNDLYLWYDELPDLDPGNYNDPLDYFALLKTDGLSPSGTPKDRFHFTQDTESYEQRTVAGVSFGYGADFVSIRNRPPRLIRVGLVYPNTPASLAGLRRGDTIIEVDGVDVENSNDVDTLNAGLTPRTDGESHTFLIEPVGTNDRREVTLTAGEIELESVPALDIISTASGNVGYMKLKTFASFKTEDDVINAMQTLDDANISDLVLDLRYNGGGYVYISSQLAYMIAGPGPTNGKIYDLMRWNDKHPDRDPVRGTPLETPFYTTATRYSDEYSEGTALPFINLNRVFILTTGSSCSASEALINGLRGVDIEVILIGDTTCGKPYGFYATDNCGTTYFTIMFDGLNDKGEGGYSDGFTPMNAPNSISDLYRAPGCYAPDDYDFQLGDPNEPLFAAALQYRADGSCPAITKTASLFLSDDSDAADAIRLPEQLNEKLLFDPFKASEKD